MSQARVVEVIVTTSQAGRGVEADPIRKVTELWTLGGKLIAEYDNATEQSQVWAAICELP